MGPYRFIVAYLVAILTTLFILFLPYIVYEPESVDEKNVLKVLTYSSFIQSWGPGPNIASQFLKETGIKIQWINAGNAGLILERLKFKSKFDQADVVLGFDQFSILEARMLMKWQDVHELQEEIQNNILPEGAFFHDFIAYDWGPMAFVYREGEVTPPQSLSDLLSEEYKNTLILQDPRMSSPGLQFLFWVFHEKGEVEAYKYLEKLKSSIKVMTPSWSSGYSIFQVEKPSIVFSYMTSPYYHQLEEGKDNYRAAVFNHPHPVQVEYAGIPVNCNNCEQALLFLQFLLKKDIQKTLMEKNFMYPVEGASMAGTGFQLPVNIKYFDPVENWALIRKKKSLVDEWKKVFY